MESTFPMDIVLEDIIYTKDAVELVGTALKHIGVKCRILDHASWDVVLYDSLSETIKEDDEE